MLINCNSTTVMIYFPLHISRKYQQNPQEPNRILTEGPLFGSLKSLTFRIPSDMSRFYLGFTDSGSVTAWVRDTALHKSLLFHSI